MSQTCLDADTLGSVSDAASPLTIPIMILAAIVKGLMQTLKVPADMPIENKMISKSIESAQKKVEGNNFDIRKHLVEYDDVINKHRLAIYRRRREILNMAEGVEAKIEPTAPRSLADIILAMVAEEVTKLVNFQTAADSIADWNIKELKETLQTIWPWRDDLMVGLDNIIKSDQSRSDLRGELSNYIVKAAAEKYASLQQAFVAANLDFSEIEKGILIRSIDEMWVEHLETVDYLRRGIGLRGYGQRDPLVEYKKEAYHLYRELNDLINRGVVYSIYKTGDALLGTQRLSDLELFAKQPQEKLEFSGAAKEMHKDAASRNTVDLVSEKEKGEDGEKIGRNDLCPCGSGKKYKKCHGQ